MNIFKTLSLCGAIAVVAVAQAGISSVGGQVVNLDANPGSFNFANIGKGVNQSDSAIWAFTESSDLALSSDLSVDVAQAGTYTAKSQLPSVKPVIAAGTKVDSTMIYSDPVHQPLFFSGTVTFDGSILGVELLSSSLSATDSMLGRAGVLYPSTDSARGLELGDHASNSLAKEGITISGSTITFNAYTHGDVDEIRVITAAAPQAVPEPSGLASLLIGGLGLIRLRKRA